ncbi:SURF1 family protein [Microbacterium sp. NPDC089189]|uniref:SURF1 family cytochrome oxidase biogenesis protein n=1 Tax=Microbacterium sp. NPDC089189 TaxID=3154972 RepID=UPI0034289BA5
MTAARSSSVLRWTSYVLVGILFAVACFFLSQWQFARNAERSAQLELVERNYDAAPLPLDAALPDDTAFDGELEWHPVEIRGTYDVDDQVVVRNRPHGGTAAFEVLTPLRTDDGRTFIVDRGWVPPAETGEGTAAVPAPPTGEVTVVVRLRAPEALPTSGRSAPAGQVPTIHLPLVAETTGAGTITGAYGILVSETPAPDTTPYPLGSPSEDPGPHLSYAVQWILFAIMGFIFIGYIIRTERRLRREDEGDGEEADAEQQSRTPRRPRARRERVDRDADVEDALLDRAGR